MQTAFQMNWVMNFNVRSNRQYAPYAASLPIESMGRKSKCVKKSRYGGATDTSAK